jgi:hypothetical protein
VVVAAVGQADSGRGCHVVVEADIFLSKGRGSDYVAVAAVGQADSSLKGRGYERRGYLQTSSLVSISECRTKSQHKYK